MGDADILTILNSSTSPPLPKRGEAIQEEEPLPSQSLTLNNPTASDPDQKTPVTAWSPPSGLTDHGGGQLSPDSIFFVPPPTDIGRITSAATSVHQGTPVWKPPSGVAGLVIGVLAGVFWGCVLAYFIPATTLEATGKVFLALGLTVLSGLGGYFFPDNILGTQPDNTCSYVGDLGIAVYRCQTSFDNLTEKTVCRFSDCHALYCHQHKVQDQYGRLQGGSYQFNLQDEAGRNVVNYRGGIQQYDNTNATFLLFLQAAEASWTRYLMPMVEQELVEKRSCIFDYGVDGQVEISPSRLQVNTDHSDVSLFKDRIKSIKFSTIVTIWYHDQSALLFTEKSVEMEYEKLANAAILRELLARYYSEVLSI